VITEISKVLKDEDVRENSKASYSIPPVRDTSSTDGWDVDWNEFGTRMARRMGE
jgi:hypothetical protein